MLCKICSSREIENYCWLCIHKHIPTESVFSHDSTTSFHYWTVQCWSQLQEGQIWFFSWWGKNLQLQTLPNMKDRTLGPVQGENISKTHSKAPLCKTSAFWASFSSFFCLTLIWSQKPNFNQLITSQTTTNMLKCKYYIQTRSWKNWLSREQDLQKQLELSSIQINFLNPLKPILFLILQALHSLCTHFLPHTGPTQLSTSAGLEKSFCRRYRKPDWCPKEHWYHPTIALHNGSTARHSLSTPQDKQVHMEYQKAKAYLSAKFSNTDKRQETTEH